MTYSDFTCLDVPSFNFYSQLFAFFYSFVSVLSFFVLSGFPMFPYICLIISQAPTLEVYICWRGDKHNSLMDGLRKPLKVHLLNNIHTFHTSNSSKSNRFISKYNAMPHPKVAEKCLIIESQRKLVLMWIRWKSRNELRLAIKSWASAWPFTERSLSLTSLKTANPRFRFHNV